MAYRVKHNRLVDPLSVFAEARDRENAAIRAEQERLERETIEQEKQQQILADTIKKNKAKMQKNKSTLNSTDSEKRAVNDLEEKFKIEELGLKKIILGFYEDASEAQKEDFVIWAGAKLSKRTVFDWAYASIFGDLTCAAHEHVIVPKPPKSPKKGCCSWCCGPTKEEIEAAQLANLLTNAGKAEKAPEMKQACMIDRITDTQDPCLCESWFEADPAAVQKAAGRR